LATIIKIFDWIKDKLEYIVNVLVMALPNSPFSFFEMPTEVSKWFAYVNWFIPIATFVAILENWLIAITVWYMIQTYLRWAKVTE